MRLNELDIQQISFANRHPFDADARTIESKIKELLVYSEASDEELLEKIKQIVESQKGK